MYYFKFVADTPYSGTENTYYLEFLEYPTNAELTETAEEICRENAESYDYLVTGWNDDNFEDEDEAAEAVEDYYAGCNCIWEEITEEEFEENN